MRILVTGATGGLGRNAVEFLLARGVDVHATGRNVETGRVLTSLGARFTAVDLAYASADEFLRLVDGVEAVWHCAALSSPWGVRKHFEESNVVVTENLLETSGKERVKRFIHISTPAIYFDYTNRYNIDESFCASTPVNEYARTKALAESAVRKAGKKFPELRTVILRPRAIFGAYDQVLLPRLSQLLSANRGRLPLPRGGRAVIDMTYAENVVYAMWLATTKDDLQSGLTFNITNDEPEQVAIVLEKLFVRDLGQKMEVRDVPYLALALAAQGLECVSKLTGKEPRLTRYSIGVLAYDMTLSLARARAALGYAPIVTLDEGIRRTAEWVKSNG